MGGLFTRNKRAPGRTAMGAPHGLSHCPTLPTKSQIWQSKSVELFHIGLSGGLQNECSTIPCMASTSQVEKQKLNKISVVICHRQLMSACFILLQGLF